MEVRQSAICDVERPHIWPHFFEARKAAALKQVEHLEDSHFQSYRGRNGDRRYKLNVLACACQEPVPEAEAGFASSRNVAEALIFSEYGLFKSRQ